jgi:hypothetical protein
MHGAFAGVDESQSMACDCVLAATIHIDHEGHWHTGQHGVSHSPSSNFCMRVGQPRPPGTSSMASLVCFFTPQVVPLELSLSESCCDALACSSPGDDCRPTDNNLSSTPQQVKPAASRGPAAAAGRQQASASMLQSKECHHSIMMRWFKQTATLTFTHSQPAWKVLDVTDLPCLVVHPASFGVKDLKLATCLHCLPAACFAAYCTACYDGHVPEQQST